MAGCFPMCFDGRSRRRGSASVTTWSFTRWRRRWRRSSSTITGWSSGPAGLTRSPRTCCRTTSAARTSHEQLDSSSSSGPSTGRYYNSRISCWLDYRKDIRPVGNPAPQIGKVNSLATRPYLEHHCQFCGFPPVGLYWDRFMRKRGVEGWVNLGGWLHTEIKWRPRKSNPDVVSHPSTNRPWHKLTLLIKTNALPCGKLPPVP